MFLAHSVENMSVLYNLCVFDTWFNSPLDAVANEIHTNVICTSYQCTFKQLLLSNKNSHSTNIHV